MSKRVYKFTKAQYGISNLHDKRLKLSTIHDLNDPFDLCPIDTTGQEVRMFVGLNDPPDASGLRWIDFGTILELKEVIIGVQCAPRDSDAVVEALKPYGDSVKCFWAGMRPDAFLLVRLDNPPGWHSSVKL